MQNQKRWDDKGINVLEYFEEKKYIISSSPIKYKQYNNDLLSVLGCLKGKKILEIGCGRGEFSVYMSKQNANVIGIDISNNLLNVARHIAYINNTHCEFELVNAVNLPYKSNEFDIVLGLHVLHHLSECDLKKAVSEAYRVSKNKVIFAEPIENSKIFSFIQNLIPTHHRPSIISRKKWKQYTASLDDRPLKNKELIKAGKQFASTLIYSYGLFVRLNVFIKNVSLLNKIDTLLFKMFPFLKYFCQSSLVVYRK